MFKTILLILSVSTLLSAQDCDNRYVTGLPTQDVDKILCKKRFILGYSRDTKTPLWAVEHLKRDELTKKSELSGFRYRRDYALERKERATSSDYAYSTQDRSFLVPFEDVSADHSAASETFMMSNIVPQDPKLNRYAWIYLERGVRELADVYEEVYVVTGVAYLDKEVKHIGHHKIAVPTHFYKAVYAPNTVDGPKMWAWIVPNEAIKPEQMKNYRLSVDTLEEKLNIDLFPGLKPTLQASIERKVIPL